MKIEETLKARREEILAIAEKYGVRNVRIFGSVARGEADDRSDLEEALPPVGDGILILAPGHNRKNLPLAFPGTPA